MDKKLDSLKGKLIVGIDLGTTNSEIAAWDSADEKVVMLADTQQQLLTPSQVGWDHTSDEWVVGDGAKALGQKHPENVAYSIKRYIGRWFTDPVLSASRQHLNYKLVRGEGKDQLHDVLVDFGSNQHGTPMRLNAPEISAKVLFKLRQDAAHALHLPLEEIQFAVITVPAYFNVLQRKATIEAGRLAGLEVVDILNEPTAAALAYGDVILRPEQRHILIYDLGGGTFDISLLKASRDEGGYVFYTLVVDGDTHLGGDDIDASIAWWLAIEIERRYGHPVLPDDRVTRERLRRVAEQAKIALSDPSHDVTIVELSQLDLGERSPFEASLELTRSQLEKCAEPIIEKTLRITKRAVVDVAELTWEQIDEVILVGGQTLMPAVQQAVATLTGHMPRVNDRPQLAVALGAGEYAHILSQGQEQFHKNTLLNVIALPLGIRLDENTFKSLVPANVTLPHTSERYPITTTEDQQTLINVEVLQGTRDANRADQCVSLGAIDMEVPPAPARTLKFEVEFDVLTDGTMKVAVSDTRRNRTETLDIVENRRILVWRGQPANEEKNSPV
jgi:molecular chaperone DnaK